MSDIREEAARAVIAEAAPFETAVDAALARSGRMIASLAENSMVARLEPRAIQPVLMAVIGAAAALGQAREGVVATRREMVLARTRLGLRETSFGGLTGCSDLFASAADHDVRAELAG